MKLVIDISKNHWKEIQHTATTNPDSMNWYERKISEGTPLPEHHGDLVDRNSFEYLKTLHDAIHGKISWSDALHQIRYSAPTIIPATREQNIQGCSTCCFAKQCQLREHLYRSTECDGCTEWKEKEQSCLECLYYPNTAPCDSCEGYSNYNEW